VVELCLHDFDVLASMLLELLTN